MNRLETLTKKVEELYINPKPEADVWLDWGYKNHVLIVVKNAKRLAAEKKANVELCVAGALLHDIADTEMSRFNDDHEKRSLEIAEELLKSCDFSEEETKEIILEIITPHSCKELLPTTMEGQVMATADSIAHFQTDFYTYFLWQHWGKGEGYPGFKEWVISKTEKDFTRKIFFDDVRESVRKEYEALRIIFSK